MPVTKEPYTPDMDACRMVIHTQDAICYVMDTHCRNTSAEQRTKIDDALAHIYRQAILHRRKKAE